MIIRDDVPIGRNDETRTQTLELLFELSRPALSVSKELAKEWIVEEILKGIAVGVLLNLGHVDPHDGRTDGRDCPRDCIPPGFCDIG
jgi:hypothetical protein